MTQTRIADTPDKDPRQEQESVWVVVYRRMDDPHPHVAGVYTDEDNADQKMRECEDTHSEPSFAVAWEKEQVQINET